MAINTMFPPIIATYMPAFLINSGNIVKDTCRVYFSISAYNSFSEIANAQVTVSSQNTNTSVLDLSKYPCAIMLTQVKEDITKQSDDKYYIEIKKDDIQGGNFELGQYYKVQIRFTTIDASSVDLETPQSIDSWLIENLQAFSEWSRVTIIHGISVPKLEINGFDAAAESVLWTSTNIDIVGKITFADKNEDETLKNYEIKLYNSNQELVSDSGIIYSNNFSGINEINYTLKHLLKDGETYTLEISYTTRNLYSETQTYEFTIVEAGGDKLDVTVSTIEDEENGRIGIHIKGKDGASFNDNVTIRRASSESNYTIWEDVHTEFIFSKNTLDYTWYDYTVKSGIWYKYGVQKRNSAGNRGVILELENPVLIDFEHMFLTIGEQQLKINFNPSISSFQHTIAESKVDTIGSQFPFVKRNGVMNYKQFPISGLISFLSDEDELFISKEKLLQNNKDLYEKYNWNTGKVNISDINNRIYERLFREEVMKFLYKHNVKLFRSATEGNILVKLTDITFTPEEQLGRHIYSFNCNAYEIDEYSIENCNKYGIQFVGNYSNQKIIKKEYIGQSSQIFNANEDVIQTINKKYQQYAEDGYVAAIDYLDYLRLEMEDKPYLIGEDEYGPYPINDTGARSIFNLEKAILGYIAYINNQPIVINKEGILELKGENVKITSLYFPVNTALNINYNVKINYKEDLSQIIKVNKYYKRVGQYWGSFKYNKSIYQAIWNKYYQKYDEFIQTLTSLNSIRVEADPGTVVYIKESEDNSFEKHVIGETCSLELNNEDSTIEGIYFSGVHLEPATAAEQERESVPDGKYIDTGITLNSLEDTENLVKNGVYTFGDPYLKAYWQKSGEYKLQARTLQEENTFAIVKDKIEKDNGSYNLLISPIMSWFDENDGLAINSDEIELYSIEDTGEYELETEAINEPNKVTVKKENTESSNVEHPTGKYKLNIINNTDTSVTVTEDKTIEPYSLVVNDIMQTDKVYKLTLNRCYDELFALILQQEIDKTNKFIWYNNQWYPFTEDCDLICPVEGLIDYTYECMKGMY